MVFLRKATLAIDVKQIECFTYSALREAGFMDVMYLPTEEDGPKYYRFPIISPMVVVTI